MDILMLFVLQVSKDLMYLVFLKECTYLVFFKGMHISLEQKLFDKGNAAQLKSDFSHLSHSYINSYRLTTADPKKSKF